VLADLAFDEAPDGDIAQRPESREVSVFSCGHRARGARLESADADRLDVERRRSEETAEPLPDA
jgi:hypothetical protein